MDVGLTLSYLAPDAQFDCVGNDYATVVWKGPGEMPSLAEVEAAWPTVRDALEWESVRSRRDALLAGSDWTQVADAPVDSAAWATYRQTLRDIPQDYATPDAVVWPEQP